jgi:hypothetical protein
MILYELAIAAKNREELMKALDRVHHLSKLGVTRGRQPSNGDVPGYTYEFKVEEQEELNE